MSPCPTRISPRSARSFALVLFLLFSSAIRPAVAQEPPAPSKPAGEATPATPAKPAADEERTPDGQRFFDAVTVSATLNPSSVRETPGTVSVIDSSTIQRRLIGNIADLVKFEPGIYVENNPNGVGLNGFNIRGIGGNRVMTQVDGVETSEQFDFGPFNMHQYAVDMDVLKSAEIIRGAASSLYGSDALGGVVSFFTKDPADFLGNRRFHAAGKLTFDSRSEATNGVVVIAGGSERVQTSLFIGQGLGHETSNRGTNRATNSTRTAPNDQDRRSTQAIGKVVLPFTAGNTLRATVEVHDSDIDTLVYSSQATTQAGPTTTTVSDVVADDLMRRTRFSLDHTVVNKGGLNQWYWSAFVQNSDSSQVIDEVRTSSSTGASTTILRKGSFDYTQNGYGAAIQGRKAFTPGRNPLLFTFGGSFTRDRFDTFRDRVDTNAATGAFVPSALILPTKYFPKSDVSESGLYLQGELRIGRMLLVPGVRFDRYSLDADENDQIYLNSQNPTPADSSSSALSSKIGVSVDVGDYVTLHSQYAGGFRAPPYSAINNGFANPAGGYISLANPDLGAETSDNFEAGVRASNRRMSVGLTGFVNHYDDFIEMIQIGVNPTTRLLEFQNQNISKVIIKGIELRGDVTVSRYVRLRASYAVIRGNDVTGDADVPLTSIAPDQGAVALQFDHASNRWGGDVTVRGAQGQALDRVAAGNFTPSAYAVLDVTGWMRLGELTLRAGVLNATNATYYEWSYVRGRSATDAVLSRYTSPGVSGIVSVGYGW